MTQSSDCPIGVFDSGVGGLTVVKSLMEELPEENIVYFGDTARVPYGVKSPQAIRAFSTQITEFLIQKKVKMLVIACNTIAAVAKAQVIEIAKNLPVLDVIDSGAKAASLEARKQSIGIIATSATVESGAYEAAIKALLPHARVYSQACPLWVPLVEEGLLDHLATELIAKDYLEFLNTQFMDVLLLGCTHYPLLSPLIKKIAGQEIVLVDPAKTIACDVKKTLALAGLLNSTQHRSERHFYVSDVPVKFQNIAERFLGETLENLEVASLD